MHYHFISIGGAVMHNLALDILAQGHTVTGSDDEIFDPAYTRLKDKNLLPAMFGWFPEKITPAIDIIIVGMHARADNPELLKAQELGLTIYSFPEYIYQHCKNKTRVVVGGSHGKTTTTAMIMHVLRTLGKEFDYLVGSAIDGFERMVKMSDAPIAIIEGDEYLTSPIDRRPKFLLYHANIAQLTGIAWDHINVFPTFDEYLHQFALFISQLPDGAPLAYYQGDEYLQQLVAPHRQRLRLLPYKELPHTVENGKTHLTLGETNIPLQVFGLHNLQNMAGAKLLCNELGINDEEFYTSIASFGGTARRLEKIKDNGDVVVFRDFAHSPSKVKATVEAVKQQYAQHHLVACFELHTYSSLTAQFLKEYKGALDKADEAIVYFNAHVLELKKLPPLDAQQVKNAFGNNPAVFSNAQQLRAHLSVIKMPQIVFLMMSSGNFDAMELDF